MAKKAKRPLRPIHTLSSRQVRERRFARKAGFKDEYAYRRWVKANRQRDESDPAYFQQIYKTEEARLNEIRRVKKVLKRKRTPANDVVWKANLLVDNGKSFGMSPFVFMEKYRYVIERVLKDPSTTATEKRKLRALQKKMSQGMRVREGLTPGEQGELF